MSITITLIDHQKLLLEDAKATLKNEIKNSIYPFSINLQKMVKSYSADKDIKEPSFTTIKNTLYKQANKYYQMILQIWHQHQMDLFIIKL